MFPDLLELLGITARGRAFELSLWSLVVACGALLFWRERRAGRVPRENPIGWGVAIAATLSGVVLLTRAAQGELTFGTSGLHVSSYGVAMMTGFAVGAWLSWRNALRLHALHPAPDVPDGAQILDLCFWVLVSSLVGSRVMFTLTRVDHYVALCFDPASVPGSGGVADCWAAFRVMEGGVVFLGGVIGALIGGWIWCRRNGIRFLAAADVLMAPLGLGHAIGRMGCFAAGCCWGARTDGGPGVVFPAPSPPFNGQFEAADAAGREVLIQLGHAHPVHAVQLYESGVELVIFVLLQFVLLRRRPFEGAIAIAWLALYTPARFVLEMFRGDTVRGYVVRLETPWLNELLHLPAGTPPMLTTSQVASAGLFVLAIVLWVRRRRGQGASA